MIVHLLEGTFVFALFLIIYQVVFFPVILYGITIVSRFSLKKQEFKPFSSPHVTVLVTCYNEGEAISEKALSLVRQDYPNQNMDIIFAADGSPEDLSTRLGPFFSKNFKLIQYPENRGKISVINDTLPKCQGEIVVFTDADAIFKKDAITNLVQILASREDIGGVCGRHVISNRKRKSSNFIESQKIYWSMDSLIKTLESRIGSISSCYGTIYAIKKKYFTPLPGSVTDDAFQAMAVVRKGKKFIFAPKAVACLKAPSKDPAHELQRRRRIVLQSMRGLWLSRELFNFKRFGFYSISLFSHKVLRKMIPFFMVLLFVSSFLLSFESFLWMSIFSGQAAIYAIALMEGTGIIRRLAPGMQIRRFTATVFYFCIGNLGTLLGAIDFFRGVKIDRWGLKEE
jgi:cellulose synthase/poly-beta-1,6-N-acetylglucosamine synthase-like glycosyltransferase